MPVLSWEIDKEAITQRISCAAPVKLCVKVLNEPLLIEGWIRHHQRIVGFDNIIIADNGSTDAETLRVYEAYSEVITIFTFAGPHNEIHWHPRFSALFNALRETCEHFGFIDVDERLVWLDENSWMADDRIVENIRSISSCKAIATTWLINLLDSFDTFTILDTEGNPNLNNNLRWGKPLLPPSMIGIQPGIHNAQFDHSMFTTEFGVNLFLLHFTQFPDRRISANKNKLVSRGIIDRSVTISEIAAMDFKDHADKSVLRFVNEIRQMIQIKSSSIESDVTTPTDYLKLEIDGGLHYSTELVRSSLKQFRAYGADLESLMLTNLECLVPELNNANSLYESAREIRRSGLGEKAIRLFNEGMIAYPDFLDQYGHSAFRKELMRTFLDQRDWSKAEELIPLDASKEKTLWHLILFARGLSQAGDDKSAAQWWRLVLEQDCSNIEAKDFFGKFKGPS